MNNNINKANIAFWNELCGSQLARQLGITDHTKESLHTFDTAYFDFYPYLLKYIQPGKLSGKDVLEIGLGYGTLGQKIAKHAGSYQGLDISFGPVRMMNHRLRLYGSKGTAVQGSALCMPFEDSSFDRVISIGCFHHTGNAGQCIRETFRVLRPGGRAIIMLYNQFSYRQWTRWPIKTALALADETFNSKTRSISTESQRKAYDAGLEGQAAPETEFFSKKRILGMFSLFSCVNVENENCDALGFTRLRIYVSRKRLLPYIGRFAGLDHYVEAIK